MDKKLIANEIDELQRVVQDLKRNEDLDISLGKLVTAFSKSKEVELSDDIWDNLENTESNEITKGDIDSVRSLAKKYGKTSPDVLVKALKSD
jgi:5-methylthioribose kinase